MFKLKDMNTSEQVEISFDDLEKIEQEAKKSAIPSHNSQEAIKGAQGLASAIYLARQKTPKEEIKELPLEIIEEIISRETLKITDEDLLLDFLIDLYESNMEKIASSIQFEVKMNLIFTDFLNESAI